jgi:DNA-binding transcriptional MerR regulator
MPEPRAVLNAFTAQEMGRITGLSVHMVNYLAREGYLGPTYDQGGIRGRVRYYSYRDLMVARIVQRLRESGLELRRLKAAIQLLSEDRAWLPKKGSPFHMIATDGRRVYFYQPNGSLVELTRHRQQTFAFVLDVTKVKSEVITRMEPAKRKGFVLENRPLVYAKPDRRSRRSITGL